MLCATSPRGQHWEHYWAHYPVHCSFEPNRRVSPEAYGEVGVAQVDDVCAARDDLPVTNLPGAARAAADAARCTAQTQTRTSECAALVRNAHSET